MPKKKNSGNFNFNIGAFQPRYVAKASGSYSAAGVRVSASLGSASGAYNPGGYQEGSVSKPSGAYNPGSGFENRDLPQPSGAYNPGRFELRDVNQPTGQYNAGTGYGAPEGKDERDPWGNYSFSVMLNGVEIGSFLECSGMKSTAEVHEIEEGGMNFSTHKRVGRSKWDNLVLKHGECAKDELHAWRDRWINDGFKERTETTLTIILRDNDGMELRRFEVARPWPVSWEGPSLNGGSSDLAVQTLEIAHDGMFGGKGETPDPPDPIPDPVPDKLELEPVYFDFDKDTMKPEGEAAVAKLSADLEEHPEITEMWVEGHTDNKGSHAYNRSLSARRAEAVASRLRAAHPDKTIHSAGYSYDHPVASNANSSGRAQNRRTEVWTSARGGSRAGEL